MIKYKVENIRKFLDKLLTNDNFLLLQGKEVEIKEDLYVKLVGNMNFTVEAKNGGIEIIFKIKPLIKVNKFIEIDGELTSIFIYGNKIEFRIDGMPDVVLEAIS